MALCYDIIIMYTIIVIIKKKFILIITINFNTNLSYYILRGQSALSPYWRTQSSRSRRSTSSQKDVSRNSPVRRRRSRFSKQ